MKIVILAHNSLLSPGGKTARGIYFYSTHEIVGIIDKQFAGKDASEIFPGRRKVPIFTSIREIKDDFDALLIGTAPIGGKLPRDWREEIKEALFKGKMVISGLHDFLSEDKEFSRIAEKTGAKIWDARKPPKNMKVADGSGKGVNSVLVAGTDVVVGKMVTAVELHRKSMRRGISAGFIATGQTGIMVGCDAGAVIDRIPGDFMAGVLEDMVKKVSEKKDIVFVEGQGDILHPAYSGVSLAILHGSYPRKIVLVHDPTRKWHLDYPDFPLPSLERYIELYEKLAEPISGGKVAAISINGENLSNQEINKIIEKVESELGLPTTDVLRYGAGKILDALL